MKKLITILLLIQFVWLGAKAQKDTTSTDNISSQKRWITGTIIDYNNDGIPGVIITIQGTTTKTVSDWDGQYKIQVGNSDSLIRFEFLGFITKTLQIKENTNIFNCQLKYTPVTSIRMGYHSETIANYRFSDYSKNGYRHKYYIVLREDSTFYKEFEEPRVGGGIYSLSIGFYKFSADTLQLYKGMKENLRNNEIKNKRLSQNTNCEKYIFDYLKNQIIIKEDTFDCEIKRIR